MKVGWLSDRHDFVGGGELTQAEFRAAAPEGVEVVNCPKDAVVPDLDRYVIHNCVTYSLADLQPTQGAPFIKYLHDVWPHGDSDLRERILTSARCVFTSPLHRDRFPWPVPEQSALIPPALDLQRLRPTRQIRRNGKREGTVCVGTFLGPGKGGVLTGEWAEANGGVDVYGHGPYAPAEGPQTRHLGLVSQADLPQTLWRYKNFIHLPSVVEPFGRAVVEAWAAGCSLVINKLVGARYWIGEKPEKLETAAEDFWAVVLDG